MAFPRLAAAATGLDTRVVPLSTPASTRDAVKVVRRLNPAFVGIQVFTHNRRRSLAIASALKEGLPRASLLLGGPHITYCAPDQLRDFAQLADFLIAGDGEIALDSVLTSSPRAQPGTIVRMPVRDLDSLPFPDYSVFGRAYSIPAASLMLSRGCPGRCLFCTYGLQSGFRSRSADNILSEIEYMTRMYGTHSFHIHDEAYASVPERAVELFDRIRARFPCVELHMKSRFDWITADLVRSFARAGGRSIFFGLETGSESLRAKMGKAFTNKEVLQVRKLLANNDIRLCVYVMFGFPGETRKNVLQTISLLEHLRPSQVRCTVATIFPGTALYNQALSCGAISHDVWGESPDPLVRWPRGERLQLAEGCVVLVGQMFAQPATWRQFTEATVPYISSTSRAYVSMVKKMAAAWLNRVPLW